MTKFLRKEKMNYLRGNKPYLDNTISYEIINNNNISNKNNINTTLTNISNQLKNIAIIDKSKEFKLLNSSFRINNKNPRNIISNNINNNLINSSLNIDNNQNQNKSNFLDITSEINQINQKFHGLKKARVFSFNILKQINKEQDNNSYEEIMKENSELKENIKFLLNQIKKYQKSGLTIEDMDINRKQEIENLEKQLNDLKEEINKYKRKIVLYDNNNNKLIKENLELRNYIKLYINKIKINSQKEKLYKISSNNLNKNKTFDGIGNNKEFEQLYDIEDFKEKNLVNNELNVIYNIKKRNIIENDIENNSKLSEELLADINNDLINENNKNNFLYVKEYSNHASRFRKTRNNYSEGKLYCRKNIGKRYLNFNDDPYSTKKSINNNITYSKSHLKNNISFKKY